MMLRRSPKHCYCSTAVQCGVTMAIGMPVVSKAGVHKPRCWRCMCWVCVGCCTLVLGGVVVSTCGVVHWPGEAFSQQFTPSRTEPGPSRRTWVGSTWGNHNIAKVLMVEKGGKRKVYALA